MSIPFIDLKTQYKTYKQEIDESIHSVLESSQFILGPEIESLEKELAGFCGAPYAIACANGTDALQLALMAIDIEEDDEVMSTPFTFVSTLEVVGLMKAKTTLVDIDERTYNIDPQKVPQALTTKTKAIVPVSLFGLPADIDSIQALAPGKTIIEDAAQSFGALYKGKRSGNLSELACTSFFPAKPLGCFGDGGALFTDNESLAQKLKSLRMHGSSKQYHYEYIGMNSRLDSLQAAILRVKLRHYQNEIDLRQEKAQRYQELFSKLDFIQTPFIPEGYQSVYAQYCIRVPKRDELKRYLSDHQIPSAIYYPVPLHLTKAYQDLGYRKGDFPVSERVAEDILALPFSAFLQEADQEKIVKTIESFYRL